MKPRHGATIEDWFLKIIGWRVSVRVEVKWLVKTLPACSWKI
jgi:hypothetical protein